jgi:hypothetical protein
MKHLLFYVSLFSCVVSYSSDRAVVERGSKLTMVERIRYYFCCCCKQKVQPQVLMFEPYEGLFGEDEKEDFGVPAARQEARQSSKEYKKGERWW